MRSIEKMVNGAAMGWRDRDRIQFLFAKPALDAVIDLMRLLAINPERDSMIRKRKNRRVNWT